MIARRTVPLTGEVNESSWEAGKYSIGGNDVMETITNIQRDVFAFVADFDQEVTVTFTVEAGLEDDIETVGISGVAKFVGIPLQNAETLAKKHKNNKKEAVSMTGKVMEIGVGTFYVTQANGKELNFSGKAIAAVHRAIDDYSKTKKFITCNLDVSVENAAGILGEPVS